MRYSTFSKLKPLDYPEGVNEDIAYMPEDCVALVIIVDTHGGVCRSIGRVMNCGVSCPIFMMVS